MGNSNEPKIGQLTFQQSLEDPHFGPVDIYRTNQGLFIMKITRTAISGDRHHTQMLKIVELVTTNTPSNIVPIVHLHQTEQKTICVTYEKTEIYTEYYNYTLLDLFSTKREVQQSELWFILQSILELIIVLQKHELTFPIELSRIFLTPAGMPYIYHYHLRSCKESIGYCEFTMIEQLAIMITELALNTKMPDFPQEIVRKDQFFVRMMAKYKILGSVVSRIMSKKVNQWEVLQEMAIFQQKELIKIGSEVKLLKFKYNLPDNKAIIAPSTFTKAPSSQLLQPLNKQNKEMKSASKSKSKANPHNILRQSNRPLTQKSKMLQTEGSSIKQARSSIYTNSSSKPDNHLLLTKEDNFKELTNLQLKKEEYRLQLLKFQQRKQQMLQSYKEAALGVRKSIKKKESTGRTNERINERFR